MLSYTAQTFLHSTPSLSPSRTYTFQGCVLDPDGALAARLRSLKICSFETGSLVKARVDLLDSIAWLTEFIFLSFTLQHSLDMVF